MLAPSRFYQQWQQFQVVVILLINVISMISRLFSPGFNIYSSICRLEVRMKAFSVAGVQQGLFEPQLVTSKEVTQDVNLLNVIFETNPLGEIFYNSFFLEAFNLVCRRRACRRLCHLVLQNTELLPYKHLSLMPLCCHTLHCGLVKHLCAISFQFFSETSN